jgi:hypothetical protein
MTRRRRGPPQQDSATTARQDAAFLAALALRTGIRQQIKTVEPLGYRAEDSIGWAEAADAGEEAG